MKATLVVLVLVFLAGPAVLLPLLFIAATTLLVAVVVVYALSRAWHAGAGRMRP